MMTDSIKTLGQQANEKIKAGQYAQAALLYEKVLELDPNDLNSLINLGTFQVQTGSIHQGLQLIEQALISAPDNISALNTRANAFKALKRYQEALETYNQVIQMQPGFADAWANRGNLLREMNQYPEALESYNQALGLKPEEVNFLNQRALLLRELQRCEEAIADLKKALQIKPEYAAAYFNLANLHVNQNQVELALQCFNQALAINPQYADAYNNRSNLFKSLNRLDAALEDCERAIQIKPDYVEAHWNQALLYLLKGDYIKGWEAYEWRWKRSDRQFHERYQPLPRWTGQQDISGKNIVLHAEQGFGDTIQFCRYVPVIAAQGANVYLDVPPPLRRLLSSLDSKVQILGLKTQKIKIDLHTPMMSLPWIFKHDLHDIPSPGAYLAAEQADIKRWSEKLNVKRRKRVGLAWAGNPDHTNDHRRSVALSALKPLFEMDFEFHSIQKDIPEKDRAVLGDLKRKFHHHDLDDFADTAALIHHLDLVITIDSAVAHLSAALGCPTWIMLPYAPDFRWMLNRSDSLWYPSVRLFRQSSINDWDSLIEQIGRELESMK